MQRSKYFNYTRPTETQLNNTETSRANTIQQRFRATAQFGVVDGFLVTINVLDGTKLDIGPGEGYTGGRYQSTEISGTASGERISTYDLGYTVSAQALANYTLGTRNYISLVYSEVESAPLAEKYYPFTHHNTIVSETFSVSVLTEADWNSLSLIDLDSRVLIAIVTAQGVGVALTLANVDQASQPNEHPTPTQPVNITGVTLESLSSETKIGVGTLRYAVATNMLYWSAPGDGEGAGVSAPSSGLYRLYSNDTTYWLDAAVTFGSLPVANQTDTITITSLYGKTIPSASAADVVHRDMVGTGTPSARNPHAQSLEDLDGGTFTHADLFHINGISSDADRTQLECSIDGVNDQILINNIGAYANSFLIDGHTYELIDGAAAGVDGSVAFDTLPATPTGDYIIYLDSSATPRSVLVGGALWDPTAIRIVDIRNTVGGNGTITWDAATSTLSWWAPGDIAAGTVVRILGDHVGYYKLYSLNTANWILVEILNPLGASNASVITVNMNQTDHPEDNLLRLCIVNWDLPTETLSGLIDLRRFITSDNQRILEEEHDARGFHTKTLQNPFRVAYVNSAIQASVDSFVGVYGDASVATGVYGKASASLGVVGVAPLIGVGGFAPTATGVWGSANNIGVIGQAVVATGVYGTAPTLAGVFLAPNTVLSVSAAVDTAGWFIARSRAIEATATANLGIYASAPATAISATVAGNIAGRFYADGVFGVIGSAPTWAVMGTGNNTAILGTAVVNTGILGAAGNIVGVHGGASATGGYFIATAANGVVGVYATASATGGLFEVVGAGGVIGARGNATNTGLYGSAIVNTGVFGSAVSYGVYGKADTMGVYGSANATGVIGSAVNTGVFGFANATNGVLGVASQYGVQGSAFGNEVGAGVNVVGVYGIGQNIGVVAQAAGVQGLGVGVGATGVYGTCAGQGAMGIVGYCNHAVAGTGVYGRADAPILGIGLYGHADGSAGTGVYGQATASHGRGVVGAATWVNGQGFGGSFNGSYAGVSASGGVYGIAVSNTINYGVGIVLDVKVSHTEFIPICIAGVLKYIHLYSDA